MAILNTKTVGYFVAILLVVILYSVLATLTAEEASSLKNTTDSVDVYILTDNGTATTLGRSGSSITNLTASVVNQSWLDFDGVDDYIVNESTWSNGGSMTINIWYNRTGNTTTNQYFFESLEGTTPVFYCDDSARLKFSAGGTWCLTPETVCDLHNGVWTMYTHVFNGTNYTIYINGTAVNISETGGGVTWKGFEIGGSINDGDGTPTVNGSLDELRVYNRSLDEADLAELYESGIIPNSSLNKTGLILWWKFDEGTTSTTHSVTNDSINGTISGATWSGDEINITLTEDTDYYLVGNVYTVMNDTHSWRKNFVSYVEEWDVEGFHTSIMDLVVGFIALAVLVFVFFIVLQIYKENQIT